MKRTNDEQAWTNFRFTLLLIFFTVVVFTCLCKYIFRIPEVESDHYISDIKETERLLTSRKNAPSRLRKSGTRLTLWTLASNKFSGWMKSKKKCFCYKTSTRNTTTVQNIFLALTRFALSRNILMLRRSFPPRRKTTR